MSEQHAVEGYGTDGAHANLSFGDPYLTYPPPWTQQGDQLPHGVAGFKDFFDNPNGRGEAFNVHNTDIHNDRSGPG